MEPDVDYDHDSTFGGDRDSLRSDSTSLASEVTRYPEAHGRRYHAYNAGKYLFPNDEQELNRMDIEHHNQRLQLDGRLHLAPLDNPQQILDIGTGTGIWAIEMSDEYPGAEVIGTDLSPVQPTWLPPNCRFEVDDFEQEWTYGSNRFDFIHARFLLGSVSDYPTLYAQIYKALKPGGWFEISDMEIGTFSDDGSVTPDMPSVRWWNYLQEAFTRMGKPMIACARYAELMKEAGLVNVHSRLLKRPTNDWPKDPRMKEIGRFTCLNFLEGIEGFTVAAFTSQLGWSREEVEVFLAQVRKESMKRSIHGWQKGVVAYGQKPPDPLKTTTTTTTASAAQQ